MGPETLNLGWNPDYDLPWVSSSPCFYSPPPPSSSSSCPWFYSSPSPSSSWESNGVAQPSSSDDRKDDEEKKKKKPRFSWSAELHKKFLLAVDACGGPRTAVPSHILKVMNVEGLSRHNVASHLQKFRAKKTNGGLPVPVHQSISDVCYCCPSNPKTPNLLELCPVPPPPPHGFPMSPMPGAIEPTKIQQSHQIDILCEEPVLGVLHDNCTWSQQIDPMLAGIQPKIRQSQQQLYLHGQPMLAGIQPKIHQSQQQLDILGESMWEATQHNIQVDNCRQLQSGNNSTEDTHPRQVEKKRTRVDVLGGISDAPQTKKARFLWTPTKHRKFVAAVESLGLERAVPKKIMELMGVGGLNRHIIASHLQKYRIQLRNEKKREQAQDRLHQLPDFPSSSQQLFSPEDFSFIDDDLSRPTSHVEEPLPPVVVDDDDTHMFNLGADNANNAVGDVDIAEEIFDFNGFSYHQKVKEIERFLFDDETYSEF